MVTPERVPLRGFDAWKRARDPEDFGTKRRQRSIGEKESPCWLERYQRVCEAKAELPETRLLDVADRESDSYELFAEVKKCGPDRAELLIRAHQKRCLSEEQKLWEKAANAPVLGEITFTVPATKARAARECPDLPCDVVFEIEEWQAAYTVAKKAPPPRTPPSLDQIGAYRRWLRWVS
jgi:hypothetical protein